MKPLVALIGRPNVGKSTLFNRITKTRAALVDDMPGVTRDRHYGDAAWNDTLFTVIDTGGFSMGDHDDISALSRAHVLAAIREADAVVLVLDGKSGITPYDRELIDILRPQKQPVFFAVNKIDGYDREHSTYEFSGLGIDPLFPVSAEHGYGISDFLDALTESFPRSDAEPIDEDTIRIAVIGRPNVGKSSLVNRILGWDRVIVSPQPGTTRDAIDTPYTVNNRNYLLIDTAGIRRKKQISEKIEKFSIIKALKSIERCDIALIVIDADEGITDQDVKIAGYAFERGCGCIFLLNKWDLVEKDGKTLKRFMDQLRDAAKYLSFAPAMPISALTGKHVPKIFTMVETVFDQYNARVGTGPLNKIFERATTRTEPSLYNGRRIKFFYATQISTRPPTFVCFVNHPEGVHFSYQRYLINQIRNETGLDKAPVRLFLRKRGGNDEKPRKKPGPAPRRPGRKRA
ncbi:MAG: ribosome biogenesis GTPase Der [Desulfobacteraceae bacterium]|jgi:GTP-binding protein|nr:MAG: ribosome biogenesis GTPase Der [Desulfobacteraceae bacterium]